MKSFKLALPILAIAIATGAAFASAPSAKSGAALVDRTGYTRTSVTNCTPTPITCSTEFNIQMCTNGSATLYDWNGTSCPSALFHKPQP